MPTIRTWVFDWTVFKAGSGIATLLRQRHREGSLTIQLHDEDPLIPCLRLDASWDERKRYESTSDP